MLPTVTINHLKIPEWEAATAESYQTANIKIWRAEVRQLIPFLNTLEDILDLEERAKASRFQQEADRQRFVISKAVLRVLLGRYTGINPKEIRVRSGKNKKPALESNSGRELHFNISHSGNWILVAISGQEIGVDVEEIHASFSYQNLLSFSFSEEEAAFIENSGLPHQSFYQLWTRKESLLKATGKGLVDELSRIPSLNSVQKNPTEITGSTKNWEILSFPVDEKHVGSVAFLPVKTALQFFNFQL
jgi:4'-phosphopantetheinyl transferase